MYVHLRVHGPICGYGNVEQVQELLVNFTLSYFSYEVPRSFLNAFP
jgi:hypothetical protein